MTIRWHFDNRNTLPIRRHSDSKKVAIKADISGTKSDTKTCLLDNQKRWPCLFLDAVWTSFSYHFATWADTYSPFCLSKRKGIESKALKKKILKKLEKKFGKKIVRKKFGKKNLE